jgi:hypothetical protein
LTVHAQTAFRAPHIVHSVPAQVIDVASQVYNPTQPMAPAEVYDPPLTGRVYSHYIADFETFDYHQDG